MTETQTSSASLTRNLCSLQIGMAWFTEQPGGLDRYFADLLNHAAGAGVDALGLVTGSADVARQSGGKAQAYAPADRSLWHRWRAGRAAAASVLAERPIDLWASHFALYAWPAMGVLRALPHVVHFHGPWAAEGLREGQRTLICAAKRLLERRVYRSADRLIVLSKAFEAELCREYGVEPDRVRVVPGGVESQRFNITPTRIEAREALLWPTDRPVVFCVRRLVRRMGLESLIDAVDDIRPKVPDLLVIIAGRGRLETELRSRITRGGLENHIRMIGFAADDLLPTMYRAADVSIVPTETLEGFGLTTVESLAAGTPVLVTPVGGLPEVVNDLFEGLILNGTGPAAIADGLLRALNGSLPLPASGACAAYAAARFDWSVIARHVAAVYREAIAEFGR